MTCEELRRLLDEEGMASTPVAQAHLAACPDCMRLASRWAEVQGAFRSMGEEPTPPFLHARIMAHVRAAEAGSTPHRRSPLHGWRATALAALGAAVVIVGLGLYRAVPPLAGPEPTPPAVLAGVQSHAADGKAGPEMKAAARLPAAPRAESAKDELARSKEQETGAGRGAKGDDTGTASKIKVGNVASVPAPASPPAPAPTAQAGVGGVQDLEVAKVARQEQVVAAPAPATGVLQAVAPAQQGDLVRCRLRLEDNQEELDVDLPPAEAPAPDQVWLVTLHPDGRIELRDAQGQDRQAPLALQHGLTQQQARTGRYRLSQAPIR